MFASSNSKEKKLKEYFCLLFVSVNLLVSGCASFQEGEKREPFYRWSSFFNDDCSPLMQFNQYSDEEAVLNYPCANGTFISQSLRRHQQQSEVQLWIALDLSPEQLNNLSRSKCRASLIYLGPTHATIKFPCDLVHLTVTCEIINKEKRDDTFLFQLKPTKALITYSDGVQEFRVDGDRLIPLGPFKPFKPPSPSFTRTLNG